MPVYPYPSGFDVFARPTMGDLKRSLHKALMPRSPANYRTEYTLRNLFNEPVPLVTAEEQNRQWTAELKAELEGKS